MNRVAIYPGSFDPLTMGHVDIIKRAAPLFDKLYICISESTAKSYTFSLEERKQLIKECFPSDTIEVVVNKGLTAKVAKELGAQYILRGIRTYMDMEYEKSMDTMNSSLYPDLETIFLFASSHLSTISSSLVKEVAFLGGDISTFVPPNVLNLLLDKVKKNEIE